MVGSDAISFWEFAYFQGRTVSFRMCIDVGSLRRTVQHLSETDCEIVVTNDGDLIVYCKPKKLLCVNGNIWKPCIFGSFWDTRFGVLQKKIPKRKRNGFI